MTVSELIDTYCQAWSAPGHEERAALLRQVWADDATYTDPTAHLRGAQELLAHIAGVLQQFPGAKITRTSRIDSHHGVARFAWRFVEANGNELPEGIDIAFISADGSKIERIIGFFGPLKRDRVPDAEVSP